MRSYSVRKPVPPTVLSFRIVTKCRATVYVLNIFVGNFSPAFRKIIRLEKTLYKCFSWFFPGSGSPRDHHCGRRLVVQVIFWPFPQLLYCLHNWVRPACQFVTSQETLVWLNYQSLSVIIVFWVARFTSQKFFWWGESTNLLFCPQAWLQMICTVLMSPIDNWCLLRY